MSVNPLQRYPLHKEILDGLFEGFSRDAGYQILDAGSGRTSLYFLTEAFPNSQITAIVYPGDERKKRGIRADISATNYVLREADILGFEQEREFDIVLAHLLLGEATKFGDNTLVGVLDALLGIKTRYLAIIDIVNDPDVDLELLLAGIKRTGTIRKKVLVDKYAGFLAETKTEPEPVH